VAGHHHHTAAIGDLVNSLYAAGRPEYRGGPTDPSPGVPSLTAVADRLDTRALNRVVTVSGDTPQPTVTVETKCTWRHLAAVLQPKGWQVPDGARLPQNSTVGAAIKQGQVQPTWVDVLTADGSITRHEAVDGGTLTLPPDALIVAAALPLTRA
jgi:hypothetical protein